MSKVQKKDSREILNKESKETSFGLNLKNVNTRNYICAWERWVGRFSAFLTYLHSHHVREAKCPTPMKQL